MQALLGRAEEEMASNNTIGGERREGSSKAF